VRCIAFIEAAQEGKQMLTAFRERPIFSGMFLQTAYGTCCFGVAFDPYVVWRLSEDRVTVLIGERNWMLGREYDHDHKRGAQ
jgi:hypothetical protein